MRIQWIEQGKDDGLKLVAPQTKNETHTPTRKLQREPVRQSKQISKIKNCLDLFFLSLFCCFLKTETTIPNSFFVLL